MTGTLKCERCKVNAEGEKDGDVITLIRCPRCKNEVSGKRANQLYLEEARYLAAKTAHDAIFSDFKPVKSDFVTVTRKPGPALDKPTWGFFLEPNE